MTPRFVLVALALGCCACALPSCGGGGGGADADAGVDSGSDAGDTDADTDTIALPPSGHWEEAPPLLAERDALAVLVDADGAVWAFGGRDQGYVPQRTVQLLAPGADAWTLAANLVERRSFYVVFPLDGGDTLHVGGFGNGGSLANAETYGSASTSLPLAYRRELFTGTILGDGRPFVAGGYVGNTNLSAASAEVYADGAFSLADYMSEPRQGHSTVTLADGSALVCGGWCMQLATALATCERFDPAAGAFEAAPPMNVARYRHTATVLLDGTLLVTGGQGADGVQLDTAELYDPVAGTWTLLDSTLGDPKMDHTATLLADGSVLVVGGYSGAGDTTVASADGYFPADRTFYPLPDMEIDRHEHAAALMPDGSVLVIGGMTWPADQRLTSVERFVPDVP
jgi:hypothetical protein